MRRRAARLPGEPKLEACLSHLAMAHTVAPATQNHAMHARICLYQRVLTQAMDGSINAVRADTQGNVPVVMTREEVATVLSLREGPPQRVGKLLYGSG
jgi:hypothetical protein